MCWTTTMLITLIALLAIAQNRPPTTAAEDSKVIDKYIATQAAKQKGEEPEGIRKTVVGDLNHDGIADTAVLYTIEGQNGSNNYIQFLAVFLRTKSGLVFAANAPVGGKNHRGAELVSIENSEVILDTLGYGPKDPSCCPTVKGSTKYVLVGRKLNETPQKTH